MSGECRQWKKAFIADGDDQGLPTAVQASACNEKGNRQSWIYDVTFAGGEEKTFTLPCKSLPVHISRDTVLERLQWIPRQVFHEAFYDHKDKVFDNIKLLLNHRCMGDKIQEWTDLFTFGFPLNKADEMNSIDSMCTLSKLIKAFHGPIRVSHQVIEPVGKSYYFDPIIAYKGNFMYMYQFIITNNIAQEARFRMVRKSRC